MRVSRNSGCLRLRLNRWFAIYCCVVRDPVEKFPEGSHGQHSDRDVTAASIFHGVLPTSEGVSAGVASPTRSESVCVLNFVGPLVS